MRRVVITGAGTVNPLGRDLSTTLAALRAGASAIGPLRIRDLDRLQVKIGAQIVDFDPEFPENVLAMSDRSTLLALEAARQAVAQAKDVGGPDHGVIMGTAGGGHDSAEAAYRAVFAEGKQRVHPFTVPRLMANAAASQIAIQHRLQGPGLTISTACASSNHAIGLAWQMVATGQAEVMLAGGAEAMLDFGGIKVWEALRVLSPDGCRPFSTTRNGMVQGEGAAVFVLEPLERAMARGADILMEIKGFGLTSDAVDMVVPQADGAARAMEMALRTAGLAACDISYVNAHGTGTEVNDRVEAQALSRVFGPKGVAISATKAGHGHLIGAAGAVELLACLLALREGVLPPTAGVGAADSRLEVDLVTGQAREADVRYCLSNSFAFGGLNAVLALGNI